MSNSTGFSGDLLQSFSSSSSSSSSTAPHIPSDYLTTPDRSSWWLSSRPKRELDKSIIIYGKPSKIDRFIRFFSNDEETEKIIRKCKVKAMSAIDKHSLQYPISFYVGNSAWKMRKHYNIVIDMEVPHTAQLEKDKFFHWSDENINE